MPRNYTIPIIQKSYIEEQFSYEEGRGLVWAITKPGVIKGTIVGGSTPRACVRLSKSRVLISHVVWFIHNRYWPSERKEWIDHKDGNSLNNTIENLRVVNPSQNNANRKSINRISKGVSVNSNGSIRSIIQYNGKKYFLGSFCTVQEAAAAYQGASRVLHGDFSVFNRQVD